MIKNNISTTIKRLLFSICFSFIAFICAYTQMFSSLDLQLTDSLYSQLRKTNKDIVIISIDENTLTEYGAFSKWSREKTADLVEYLFSDPNNCPTVLGIDILFQGDIDEDIDTRLANACKNKNVVVSSSIKFKGNIDAETMLYDKFNISYIENPYDKLYANAITAFTNAIQSVDGANRYSAASFNYNGEKVYSLSYTLASIYAKSRNIELEEIQHDNSGLFRFFYAGKPKEFSHVSLNKVLNKEIPLSEFKDKIVLIGAYATAMQDEYYGSFDINGTMYGVEIHANIVQSILDGKTAVNYNNLYYSIILAVVIFIISYFSISIENYIISLIVPVATLIAHIIFGRYLSKNGLLIPQFYAISIIAILIIFHICRRYFNEYKKRKQVTDVFSRYMDPKLVGRVVETEQDNINLNGEKRDVSVLFVDIRGFTSMSESMSPEDVVGILNEYLSHVTECIFKHNGMLDKFIGDAAMAIFNAPVDQEDYIYESVATAYDIVNGSVELKKRIKEKYGKDINFGVGVHCGEAVIGNIGCKTRMDYTAIGDTVNTSSRIEGKAGKGEVLISVEVKEKLEGRISVMDAGLLELKGKSEPVKVYRLLDIKGGSDE